MFGGSSKRGFGSGVGESREEWGREGPPLWGGGWGASAGGGDLGDSLVTILGLIGPTRGVHAGLGLPRAFLFCLCHAAPCSAKNPPPVIKPLDFFFFFLTLSSLVPCVCITSEIRAATWVW